MIYVTHDQVEALTLGDRVAVMGHGAVQQVGTPDEIYLRPASRFVAQFVGSPSMNVLDAEVIGGRVGAGPFTVPVPRTGTATAFQIGFRPEHVRLVSDADGVPAVVHDVEIAGCDAYVYLDTGQHDLVARTDASQRPARGDRVAIDIPRERLHLFDATTGITLGQDA
jgi:sn-glycerol 3-phosphate transport system ATP-binding protein